MATKTPKDLFGKQRYIFINYLDLKLPHNMNAFKISYPALNSESLRICFLNGQISILLGLIVVNIWSYCEPKFGISLIFEIDRLYRSYIYIMLTRTFANLNSREKTDFSTIYQIKQYNWSLFQHFNHRTILFYKIISHINNNLWKIVSKFYIVCFLSHSPTTCLGYFLNTIY